MSKWVPWALGGAALVLLASDSSASKKGSKSKTPAKPERPKPVPPVPVPKSPPVSIRVWGPDGTPRPKGEAGTQCDPRPGDLGVWDEDGECKVYWRDGQTDEAVVKLARKVWEERERPSFEAMCAPKDPLDEFAPQMPNPELLRILAEALRRYYGVGNIFPPKFDADGALRSPWWVEQAWQRAMPKVWDALCAAPRG